MDAIFQFLSNLPWFVWLLAGFLCALLIGASIKDEDIEEFEDFLEKPESEIDTEWHTDIITCSVPWQQVIQLLPWEYSDYDFYSYDGYIDITLKNGNTCYLPIGFTTIVDETANKITLTKKE